MIRLYNGGVYLVNGKELVQEQETEKIRSLCGQIPDKVCQASVRIHSLAGRLAAGKYGEYAMIPSDIAEFFPEAFRQVIG